MMMREIYEEMDLDQLTNALEARLRQMPLAMRLHVERAISIWRTSVPYAVRREATREILKKRSQPN
jgi:hypothetical protein